MTGKKIVAILAALPMTLLLSVTVLAGESGAAGVALTDRLRVAGGFFGGFLLVMGAIFVILLLTKRIAAWVDKIRDKHKT